jgi:hypothetical protein
VVHVVGHVSLLGFFFRSHGKDRCFGSQADQAPLKRFQVARYWSKRGSIGQKKSIGQIEKELVRKGSIGQKQSCIKQKHWSYTSPPQHVHCPMSTVNVPKGRGPFKHSRITSPKQDNKLGPVSYPQ